MNEIPSKLYKFQTNDGWMQIDKNIYEKMMHYMNTTDAYHSLPDFFEETGIRPEKASRIISDEKRATIFDEELAILVYTFDEYFVLSKYKTYKMIDESGNENPYLHFE